jgi:hypothetical protein
MGPIDISPLSLDNGNLMVGGVPSKRGCFDNTEDGKWRTGRQVDWLASKPARGQSTLIGM